MKKTLLKKYKQKTLKKMKKLFYSMVAMLIIAATTTVFTSCSDDEDSYTVFSIGIAEVQITGATDNEEASLLTFSSEVESAYKKNLGMTEGNTLTLKNVDYKTKCAEMKQKFENTSLPSSPSLSCSYKLTFVLTAYNSGRQETIASKTFTNE